MWALSLSGTILEVFLFLVSNVSILIVCDNIVCIIISWDNIVSFVIVLDNIGLLFGTASPIT